MDQAETSTGPDLEAVRRRRSTLRASTEHLRQALAADAAQTSAGTRAALAAAAHEAQACLVAHIDATEGPDGFHNDMLTAAPRLAHDVAILVTEHARLAAMVAALVSDSDPAGAAQDLDAAHRMGARLLAAVSQHLQRGSDLIYEAFEADLGGQG